MECLSYYYLLSIRFGVSAKTFARRFEPWMHAIAIGYPLLTAIVGASMNMYSEAELWTGCTVVEYPRGCSSNINSQEIEQGEQEQCKTEMIFWIFGGALLTLAILSLVVINFIIFWHVRYRNRRIRRNSLNSQRQAQRTTEVAIQAFLYVAAFCSTFIWKILHSLSFDAFDSGTFYPLMVLHCLFMPSAGLFNLCIYLRPRYIKTRTDFPKETRIWAVKRALYGDSIAPCQSNFALPGDGGSSNSGAFLGTFRLGSSLRKLYNHGSSSVAVPNSTLEINDAQHSSNLSVTMEDPSCSSSSGHCPENCPTGSGQAILPPDTTTTKVATTTTQQQQQQQPETSTAPL